MKEKRLLEEYTAHAQELDFVADLATEPAWWVTVYPGEFREIKQHGMRFDRPVTLNVVDRQYLPEDHSLQLEIALAYNQLAVKQTAKPVIRLPATQCINDRPTTLAIVWEKPDGRRILSDEEYGQYFSRGDAVWRKLEQVFALLRSTREVLTGLRRCRAVMSLLDGKSYTDYFLERFYKWSVERQKAGRSSYDTLEQQRSLVLQKIFARTSTLGTTLELAWNVCGNTDIIQTTDGRYYLVNGRFEAKPPAFLPAAWIWNMVLHGSWRKTGQQLVENTLDAIQIAIAVGWPIGFDFNDNLLERLFAARWVDADLRRSPFDQVSEKEWIQAINNLDNAFLQIRRTL